MSAVVGWCPAGALGAAPHSPDGLAPPDAAAHWLPPEAWVYNHWLPFDEQRLYRVLHITRSELWLQLRDDHRTLAQLAARHGFPSAPRLAARLLVGRTGAKRSVPRSELMRRTERVITQGHLAQHVFFHSLHQFAIPSAAPEIFGITDIAFRRLRRSELSPLAIARLHGRTPGAVQGQSIAVLGERVRFGVREGDISARQGALLFHRQLTQLPRWLDQARYNGPPQTHLGSLVEKPRDYVSNPVLSRDGRVVAYEAYRQKLPFAVKLGEIAVLRTDLATNSTTLVSPVPQSGPDGPHPVSAYNPTISADGQQIAFEASPGNQNFAKRYGEIGTLYTDLAAHQTSVAEPAQQPDGGDARSSYNPAISADGRSLAFEAVRDGRTVVFVRDSATGATHPALSGVPPGRARYADPYEPGLSADGARIVYTWAAGRVGAPRSATTTVHVRDLSSGRDIDLGARDAANPAISPDGRFVAYVAGSQRGSAALVLHDIDSGRSVQIPTGAGLPLDPSVSDGGAVVAYTAVRDGRAEIDVWHADTGITDVASRASGPSGAIANGASGGASISGDGTRVAFASTGDNLTAGRADDTRAIYVRDLAQQATRLVSDVAVAYEVGR